MKLLKSNTLLYILSIINSTHHKVPDLYFEKHLLQINVIHVYLRRPDRH